MSYFQFDCITGSMSENTTRIMISDIVTTGAPSVKNVISEKNGLLRDVIAYLKQKGQEDIADDIEQTVIEENSANMTITMKDSKQRTFPLFVDRYVGHTRRQSGRDFEFSTSDRTVMAISNELNRIVRSAKAEPDPLAGL